MLRALLLILVFGAGGVYVAQLLKANGPGYVQISYAGFSMETSVWLFIAGILLALLVIWLVWWVLVLLIRLIMGTGSLPMHFRRKRLRKQQVVGLTAFQGQHYHKAVKDLYQSAPAAESPFVSYMLSASAAKSLGDTESFRDALKKARTAEQTDPVSLLIAEIDLAILNKDDQSAMQLTDHLMEKYPKDPRAVLKAKDMYVQSHQISLLEKTLPSLEKKHLLPESELKQLRQQLVVSQLNEAGKQKDKKLLEKYWKKARDLQQQAPCFMAYYRGYTQLGDIPAAMKKIEKQLNAAARPELLEYYASLSHDKPRQFAFLQQLLKNQGESSTLLYCLGKVAHDLGDEQQAIISLNRSITMKPTTEARILLAKVYADNQQITESVSSLNPLLENKTA